VIKGRLPRLARVLQVFPEIPPRFEQRQHERTVELSCFFIITAGEPLTNEVREVAMTVGVKDPLRGLCFQMEGKVLDSRVSWSTQPAVFIAIGCGDVSRFTALVLRDLDFIGIHKEIQEVEIRQLLPSI